MRLFRSAEKCGKTKTGFDPSGVNAGEKIEETLREMAPEADELVFWAGVGVAAEDLERGAELVRRAAATKPAWLTLLERLPADLEPMAPKLLEALGRGGA